MLETKSQRSIWPYILAVLALLCIPLAAVGFGASIAGGFDIDTPSDQRTRTINQAGEAVSYTAMLAGPLLSIAALLVARRMSVRTRGFALNLGWAALGLNLLWSLYYFTGLPLSLFR